MQERITVQTIINWIDKWAPFDSAEDWDNVGLLAGSADSYVTKVITALDISPDVVKQAAKTGAELIISHHPVIFRPIKRLNQDNPVYQIASHGISAIAVHTNMDKAVGGVNDILAKKLGLQNISTTDDQLVRIGSLEKEIEPHAFAKLVGKLLGVPAGGIMWSEGLRPVRTVAVCGGAGGDYINHLPPQADAYVTGELGYHEWPFSSSQTIVSAGHFYTESLISCEIAERLSNAFESLIVTPAKEKCPYNIL